MSSGLGPSPWLAHAIAAFGTTCRQKLAGPGDREAAIRAPLETLLSDVGAQLGLTVVPHDEVRDTERGVRPDYAISVDGAVTGYLEVKRPGHSIDPTTFRGHDQRQWERQRDLPNLIYTNGTEWRLWRDSEPVGNGARLGGGALSEAGGALTAPAALEGLLTEFLRWTPAPITSVGGLVRAIAPLTRLLRGEVLDQLTLENRLIAEGGDEHAQPFRGLAADWRALLFPEADDERFADGYAQTVTFALLLARSEAIDLATTSLHEIGERLGEGHSLMGRALQLLTDAAATDFRVTLDLLLRVVGAVRWERVRAGRRDTYLYLYEDFLECYDAELRKASGSYYTPLPLVEQMVRLTEDVLQTRLGRKDGFLDASVLTIDPAMGTGTYLSAIIDRVADRAVTQNGPGVAAGVVTDLAERLVGFELQLGPYAVAELRSSDLLRRYRATPPLGGMRSYVTNTLDDPYTEIDQIASSLQAISASRRQANKIKGETPVTVVIGNPPYRTQAEGLGGWIENGRTATLREKTKTVPLDDFRAPGNGLTEYTLKNLYIYFWRWATWKVFDAHDDDDRAGVVCFVTTDGYLHGRGFSGMREYLRRTCDEGWIIHLSPEGHRPDVSTRVFPGVQQTLAIGLFVRNTQTSNDIPATIHYREVVGRRTEKYEALTGIALDDGAWRQARTAWRAPFTPAAKSAEWDHWPAMDELMPWFAPGIKPNKTWVYSPSPHVLERRWQALIGEQDPKRKRLLFQETSDTQLDKVKPPLSGSDTYHSTVAFSEERAIAPKAVRVGYRALDRQWLVPDARLIHRPSPTLWEARVPGQLFVIEQSAHSIEGGPALLLSALIPDMDHFNNRGGRALPMLHPDGTANLAPGLLASIGEVLGRDAPPMVQDVIAYIAAVTAQPAFTATFSDELSTPGVRVPITSDPKLWRKAVALGQIVMWLHTYGAVGTDDTRPGNNVRYEPGDDRQPLSRTSVQEMPEELEYDQTTEVLRLGKGEWSPVRREVRGYEVGGRNVLDSWFNYRKAKPAGRRTAHSSPLAYMHVEAWPSDWTIELIDLLTVLSRLVELEGEQASLLAQILDGPTLTKNQLTVRGVQWPTQRKHRTVRRLGAVEGGFNLS